MKKNLFLLALYFVISHSATAQFSPVNYTENMEVHDLHFVNDLVGFAAGYNEVYKTTDGGSNWTQIASNVFTNGPVGVWFMSELTGFIIGSDGGGNPVVSKTINGGVSWATTTLPVGGMGFNAANKIFFYDSNTGYIVCRGGHIYKTVDQGGAWTELTSGITDDIGSVHFPTSQIGYASLSYSNSILKTINAGASWTLINTGQALSIFDLYFTSPNTGFLACSNSKVLKTTDGGVSWSLFSLGTNDDLYAIEFTDNSVGYAAGASGTIIATTNEGSTWAPVASGVTQLIYCMDFPSQQIGYMGTLGFPGKIIKTTNGGNVLSVADLQENADLNVFPNPTSDLLSITTKSNSVGTTYSIIDRSGRIVRLGILTSETTKVDISQLAAGAYLFQLDGQKSRSFKLMKQ